jgi:single-strand DNA-binding protein
MNNCTFAGNIGGDPRINSITTANGPMSVLNFSLAVDKRKKDAQGNKQTLWIDCALWGKGADALQQYLVKGQKISASGSVDVDSYEKNGQVNPKLTLNVSDVTLQGGQQQGGGQQAPAPQQQPQQPAQQKPQGGSVTPGQGANQPGQMKEPDFDFDDDIPF